MIKRCFFVLASLFLFIPTTLAAETKFGDEYTLPSDQTIADNLIVTAQKVTINGTVQGDLIAAGAQIEINGTVTGDVIAAGAVIVITKDAKVGKSLKIAGAQLDLGGETAGGAMITGQEVTLRGHIAQDATVYAASLNVLGTLDGNLTAHVGSLLAGSTTVIAGALSHTEGIPFTTPAGAKISQISTISLSDEDRSENFFLSWPNLQNQFLSYLASMIVGMLLLIFFPTFLIRQAKYFQERFWGSFGWGLLATILSFILVILGFITIIGVPFSLLLLAATVIMLYLGHIMVGLWLGCRVLRLNLTQPHEQKRLLLALLIGLAIYKFIVLIPVIGGLVSLIAALSGMGTLWMMFRSRALK